MRAYPGTSHPFLVCLRPGAVLLVSLVVGLILFLIWLPSETRATLLFVLRTQWILVSLLVLFALVVLSLVWTVGHHLDTQIFLLFNTGLSRQMAGSSHVAGDATRQYCDRVHGGFRILLAELSRLGSPG